MDKNNVTKNLLRFIDFNARASHSSINTVNAIVSSTDVLSQITESLELLKKDYSVLFYSGKSTDTKRFLGKLSDDLTHEKTVLIVADTLDFDPVIYDQLMQFRLENNFNTSLNSQEKISNFPKSSSLFLFFTDKNEEVDSRVYEIADHVLNLSEVN